MTFKETVQPYSGDQGRQSMQGTQNKVEKSETQVLLRSKHTVSFQTSQMTLTCPWADVRLPESFIWSNSSENIGLINTELTKPLSSSHHISP